MILWIGSLLCIAVVLCAVGFAVMRRRRPVAACGFTVVALSAVIIGDVIAAPAFEMSRTAADAPHPTLLPAPTVQAAPAPPPPMSHAAALARFETSWANVVRIVASAIAAHDSAGADLHGENPAAAAGDLKTCEDAARRIVSESVNLPLDTGRHSDANLLAAIKNVADGLEFGCKSARAYLATSKAADFNESHTRFDHVADDVVRSESLARVIYSRLGGNPDELVSFKTALR